MEANFELIKQAVREVFEEMKQAENDFLSAYPDMMTRREVAALLRVSPRTVINYERAKKLPRAERIGKKAVYPKAAIAKILKSR